MKVSYIYAKLFKKLRGVAFLNSSKHFTSKLESGTSFINSSMGKYSFCGYDCEMLNVNIGNYCSIANNVVIGGAMHPMHWVSMSPVFYAGRDSVKKKFAEYQRDEDKPVNIEHDVWIGQYSMIKQGVSIGTGAVIGMGSIVTKDVPPYEIWAGNPAKFIKKRFDDETIEKLLQSEWWNKPDSEMEKIGKYFNNVPEFLEKEL